ncbi:helix-hairpin-helix domain-containing protein [Phosphitispora sp. TUW77]|uniref:helix-hairpin-helix domain-containing protein n=1 Tax=Phosphitispora sp. TUW77 TaxID=3152361 RepID=UPI003AB387A6
MKWINRLQNGGLLPAGQTTQFIVGAAGESDAAILKTTSELYQDLGLKRVYFSAFQPVAGTPLEGISPATILREHRLYQCDFLFRLYGFKLPDISFNSDGSLPEDLDPKLNYALNNPHLFPLEVNSASYKVLLKVPGIGPASAQRIVNTRKTFKFNTLDELKNLGVVIKRASPFIQVNGRYRESYKLSQQLELWRDSVDYCSQRQSRGIAQGSHALTPMQRNLFT